MDTSPDRIPYPPGIVLLMLLLTIILFMLIGQGAGLAVTYAAGLDLQQFMGSEEVQTTLRERNIMRVMAGVNTFFTFWMPALFLGWMMYRRQWVRELTLDRSPGLYWPLNGALWIMGAFPLAQVIYWFNKTAIPLPEWMTRMEESTGGLLKAFLVMDSPLEFLFSMLIMGILPAVGEELIFRGFLQRQLARMKMGPHAAVWVAALVFSAIHFQFEGFLPRLLLGALLGYLFFFTRNLWVPIIAHFANNAMQVIAAYAMQDEFLKLEEATENPVSWPLALGSALFVLGLGYIMWNRRIFKPEIPPA